MFQSQNKRSSRTTGRIVSGFVTIPVKTNSHKGEITEERRMFKKVNSFQEELVTEIGGDRRDSRRYDMDLSLHYKVMQQYQVCKSGTGKTINFSGGGLAFEGGEGLKPGATIELAIAWPVMLNGNCPLKLVVIGKVVRSSAGMTAVRMEHY